MALRLPDAVLWTGGARRALLLGACALLAASCRTTAVAAQNLDSVLGSTNRFHYQARTTSVSRDVLRNGLGSLGGLISKKEKLPPLRAVPNPSKVARRNLVRLAASTDGPEAWRHNEQVRLLTRYARSAPSQLCRERAVLELAPHARRLGLDEPYAPPTDRTANAPELVEALDGLVDAVRDLAVDAADGDVGATARADFAGAIELLRTTRVDILGGSRMLRAIGPFLRGGRLPTEQRAELEELAQDVQRDLVQEALWAAASDTSSVVRAAGMRANIAVYGERFAIEALLALVPPELLDADLRASWSSFHIAPVLPSLDETFEAVLDAYAERGLPVAARLPNRASIELRLTIFSILWQITVNDLVFPVRVRNTAMRALETVSGGELSSLRAEEWDEWWRSVLPRLEAERNALGETEGRP